MHSNLRSKIDKLKTENPEAIKKLEEIENRLDNQKYKIAIAANKNAENSTFINALFGNNINKITVNIDDHNVVVDIIDSYQLFKETIPEQNKNNFDMIQDLNMLFVSFDFDQLDNEESRNELFKSIKKIVKNNQNCTGYFLIDKIELAFDSDQKNWNEKKNQAEKKLKQLIKSHKIREGSIFLISSKLALLKKNEHEIPRSEKKTLSQFEDKLKEIFNDSGENYETILLKELGIEKVEQAIKNSVNNAKKSLLSSINEEIEKIKNERDLMNFEYCTKQSLDKSNNSTQTFNQEIDSPSSNDEGEKEFTDNLQLELQPNYIGCGPDFCVIVNNQGVVKSLGNNYYGQLGIGNKDNQQNSENILLTVKDLPLDKKCTSVSVGHEHTLALLENGDLYAWGRGEEGELGDDTKDIRLSAFKVKGLPKDKKPVKIVAGVDSSFVLLETGDLYASGRVSKTISFTEYPLPFKVKDIELLYDSVDNGIVVVNSKDEILMKCLNSHAIDWYENNELEWNVLRGLPDECAIKKIITGSNYLFIILLTDEVYAIGADNEGQLGRSEYNCSQMTFTKIYTIGDKPLQIATNKKRSSTHWDSGRYSNFVLAVTPSKIYGWGNNENKQLGEQKEYNTDYSTTGSLWWKKTHTYRYYRDIKPKVINQLSVRIKNNTEYYLACTNDASIVFNRSKNELYLLGRKLNSWATNSDIVICYIC